ncbi:MAG TPA: hypothetical protein VLE19_10215 [Pyrinomonadaceae bacterium]|nr:hypothetical protein [Pyrinomonadaceae bacterium]
MPVQVLINQAGPLPVKAVFNAPSDAPMYLEVNGSVWTSTPDSMIGIVVQIDNNVLGQAQIYSNGNTTHRAVVPGYFPVQLDEGQHTIVLANYGGTSDSNDFFTAVLHY